MAARASLLTFRSIILASIFEAACADTSQEVSWFGFGGWGPPGPPGGSEISVGYHLHHPLAGGSYGRFSYQVDAGAAVDHRSAKAYISGHSDVKVSESISVGVHGSAYANAGVSTKGYPEVGCGFAGGVHGSYTDGKTSHTFSAGCSTTGGCGLSLTQTNRDRLP